MATLLQLITYNMAPLETCALNGSRFVTKDEKTRFFHVFIFSYVFKILEARKTLIVK